MDHFVGKCTFGGVFRCTISLGNAQNVHQFPGNSRVDGSTPPNSQIWHRFCQNYVDFSIFHGFGCFPYFIREKRPPAAKLEIWLFFSVLAPKSDPRRVVAPLDLDPPNRSRSDPGTHPDLDQGLGLATHRPGICWLVLAVGS